MDDEKKWNLNAPQNDTENNRQNEPQDMNIIVCIRIQNQIQ